MCSRHAELHGADAEPLSVYDSFLGPRRGYRELPIERRRYLTEAGKLPVSQVTPLGRFMRHVERTQSCWMWTSTIESGGYGWFHLSVNRKRKAVRAHRFMYEATKGPIPEGLELDHLCRVRHCVNPDHLEPVTHLENMRRGMTPGAVTWRTNTCRRGHSMADAYVVPATGHRQCRTCNRLRKAGTA